jgi:2-polyprenyl-3-methyl-5-hydroxy-6-metoxy-1,4-benzoquinol methylase
MAVSSYDDIAEWYDAFVGDVPLLADPFFPTVQQLIGAVEGLRVCDLACGQGRVARHLAAAGARVVGIDLSGKLLAIARRYEQAEPLGVAYVRDDAQTLATIRDRAFDGVVCHMALMDIPDLASTIRAVTRILRPGGWLCLSILHPCFQTPTSDEIASPDGTWWRMVNGYEAEGFWRSDRRVGPPGKVGSHHRTLSTYLNALVGAGLVLERFGEPLATGVLAAHRPVWREVPAVLALRCRKPGRAAG